MWRNIRWPDGFMSRLSRWDRKLSGCLPVHTLRGNFLSIVTMTTVTRGQKLLKAAFLKAHHHCFLMLRSVVCSEQDITTSKTLTRGCLRKENTGWVSKKLACESWSNLIGQNFILRCIISPLRPSGTGLNQNITESRFRKQRVSCSNLFNILIQLASSMNIGLSMSWCF